MAAPAEAHISDFSDFDSDSDTHAVRRFLRDPRVPMARDESTSERLPSSKAVEGWYTLIPSVSDPDPLTARDSLAAVVLIVMARSRAVAGKSLLDEPEPPPVLSLTSTM